MTDPPRFVFDTGVLVSAALIGESTPWRALQTALRQGSLLVSEATVAELVGVLGRAKFDRYVRAATRKRFSAALIRRAVVLAPNEPLRACRDPSDDKFLELAVAGQASFLVSSDADLLALDPFRGVRIVSPAQFLVEFGQGRLT
jgi:putative PIN family toxin of toxin-antitoxin system